LAFLAGGGDMGARMRAFDWSTVSLGAPENWPGSLKAAIRVMLTSRFAMWMAAGPDLTFFCNDAYLPTTGNKRDWVLGARSDKVWAEIWADIGPRIQRVLQTGEATWDEALLLYLERSFFPEETYHTFSYSPLDDDFGAPAGMLCVVAEVTERVIGERQLATLRDLGSRLAAAATRADVMRALEASLAAGPRDIPFALVYLAEPSNERWRLAALHGLQTRAPIAAPHIGFHAPEAPWPMDEAVAPGADLLEVDPATLGDFQLAFWQRLPLNRLVIPLAGTESGKPAGFLVAGLNPHRALDSTYRGFIDLLAAQLAAAIARADEYERERARAQALAEIDRAKTAFFSNVSHEFRTPLTLMLGPLEDALADGTLAPDQAESIAIAHRNGLRLLRLVNGLLDFSRIEAGRVKARYRKLDAAAFTADLASTFRSACERAGLALHVRCAKLPAPLYLDAEMWEKIVLNLLSNAFKFTLAGEISVELRAAAGMAELVVRDTGTGIPAAELPKLFERFHRVEGAVGRSFEGSGIGLALVAELVHLHGGTVTAESREGCGSAFKVRIPFGADHLPADQIDPTTPEWPLASRAQPYVDEAMRWLPAAPQGDPEAAHQAVDDIIYDAEKHAPSRAQGGRVLLADDNADLRAYVGRLLQNRGYLVDPVPDGLAALAAMRAHRPDLLLTDVMMPGMDGFGLLAAIRADPALADIPVIMLSARAGEEAQVEGLQAGADDYLAKPFSARELLARVGANLDVARMRREASAAIRASEARLRGVLEGMAEGFCLLDREFRIIEINAAGCRLEARARDELIGKSHWEAYPASEHSQVGQLYKRALRDRRAVALEHRHVWGDGREAWLDMRAYPTEDGGLAIFYRDVTERHRAQDQLHDLNESLERRIAAAVAEREAALSRLNETQRLETLGQLTGGVAHDFNNLLTPIMGGLELLGRRHDDERSQRLIGSAMQSAERAKTLVGRLLAFARRQTLAPQAVDPATLLQGVRDLICHSVGPAISVGMEIPANLPAALADPNQLELALLNLAVNARDAMEDSGSLTIAVMADSVAPGEAGLAPGRYVRFQITDTGHGMDPATLARAVEPFFSTKEIGKGTGLGLSMVHGLALQSGGAFRLASTVGVGTVATLWLPVAGAEAAGMIVSDVAAPRAPRDAVLLLVDDEDLVRKSIAALLAELGYEVVDVGSAAAALETLRAGLLPDLVITDHMMPGMTGAQLAVALRERVPGMPVLMITGYADLHGETPGALDVLAKPFAFSELAERVAGMIAPRPGTITAMPARAATTTRTGLNVKAEIDHATYPPGDRVTDAEMAAITLSAHTFHGEWNYTISLKPA
jgi:PAS domain S-box-containing protein